MRWFRRKHPDSTEVQRARAERMVTEQELEDVRADREYVEHLANRAEKALRVNGFGASATAAMRRRRHA